MIVKVAGAIAEADACFKPTFARCPWLRGQDRAFERLRQRQIAPGVGNERSNRPVTAR
jgi:hypothetical protein